MEAPKITAARRQDHRVELRAGCMPEKKWHLRIHTAPCTNNAVRQPPSPQSRPTANLTSPLDPVPRHHRALPFQSTLSGLHCSGLAAALDWSSLSQHGGARVTQSVPRRRRWRCSRGVRVTMLRVAWRTLSSIRTQAVTWAPVLGLPGGGCSRLHSDHWGLRASPRGEL